MTTSRFGLAALLAIVALSAAAPAHDYQAGAIEITAPWSRATAPRQSSGAGYMILRNRGDTADRLTGASSPVAGRIELHVHSIDAQGVARMREVPSIEIPAHGETPLEPTGLALMFIDLKQPLNQDTTVPVALTFEKAGQVEIELHVEGPGARGPEAMHGMGH
jgi:copper(I)-binding protein